VAVVSGFIKATARILVVEASRELRALIADVLTADGHAVTSVAHGAEAIVLTAWPEFDLVLSDLTMPSIEGAHFYWEIGVRWPTLRRGSSASPTATTPGRLTTQRCARLRCRSW
jgi:DNA-binding NarL/FixJ family response regulator